MLENVVKLKHNVYVSLDGCDDKSYELFFYLACWALRRHDLAHEMVCAIDDPLENKDVVIGANLIAYCHLGKKIAFNMTKKKAEKMFSVHPDISGSLRGTGVTGLWLCVKNEILRKAPAGTTVVILMGKDEAAIVPNDQMPAYKEFDMGDLLTLKERVLENK